MNQMKLKMLIKFDQIKILEEFYNRYAELNNQIHLELEVPETDLHEIVELIHTKSAISRQR